MPTTPQQVRNVLRTDYLSLLGASGTREECYCGELFPHMTGLTVSRYLQVEGSCSDMLRDTLCTHLESTTYSNRLQNLV